MLVLLFLTVVSIEVITTKNFSLYAMLIILIGQYLFSRNLRVAGESKVPDLPWALLILTVPFTVFYDAYNTDTYFLFMSTLGGVIVGYCLSSFCLWLSLIFTENEQDYLAGEAKMIGRCLLVLPIAFILIMIYLIVSVRGGMSTLLSVGDLVLIKRFPVIMMIGSIFPAILVARALMIFYRREEND